MVHEIIPNTIPTYIHAHIHDLRPFSIECFTPASCLRRSASVRIIAARIKTKKLFAVKDFDQKQFFNSVTSAGQTVGLRSKLTIINDEEFSYLSNTIFGFALALIVPEIMKVFRRDVRQLQKKSKFSAFLAPGDHNFDPRENEKCVFFKKLFFSSKNSDCNTFGHRYVDDSMVPDHS